MPKRKRTMSFSGRRSARSRRYKRTYRSAGRRTRKRAFRKQNPMKQKGFPRYVKSTVWNSVTLPTILYKKYNWENMYTLSSSYASSTNSSAVCSIRLNSPYDPDRSTGFGQRSAPMWDTFMNSNMYASYLVLGTKVKITFQNLDIQAAECVMGYSSDTDSNLSSFTSPATLDVVNQWTQLANIMEPIFLGTKDSGQMSSTRQFYMKAWTPFGVTSAQYKQELTTYAARYNTNPSVGGVFFFHIISANPGSSVYVNARIRMTYYVQCFNNANAPSQGVVEPGDNPVPPPPYPWAPFDEGEMEGLVAEGKVQKIEVDHDVPVVPRS